MQEREAGGVRPIVSEPTDGAAQVVDSTAPDEQTEAQSSPFADDPPNAVHARVGDDVLLAVRARVRQGMQPEQIIREMRAEHNVRMNVGELRLLLAARYREDDRIRPRYSFSRSSTETDGTAE